MIKSVIRNLFLFFSLIGIALTIYLTLFLIPERLETKRNEKIQRINQELIVSLQGLLHQELPLEPETIESMIQSKELREGIQYPYSLIELLIQTQESFISNTYIPSEQRGTMTDNLNRLRLKIENDPAYTDSVSVIDEDKNNIFTIDYWKNIQLAEWVIATGGILLSILGIYSLYYQIRVERKREFEAIINDEKDRIEDAVRTSIIFDDIIIKALDELKIDHQVIFDKFSRADVMVKTDSGKTIFIKTRYLRSQKDVPEGFYANLVKLAEANKASGIYLTNLNDKDGLKAFEAFNRDSKEQKIYMIVAETKEEMKAMLMNTVHRIEEET